MLSQNLWSAWMVEYHGKSQMASESEEEAAKKLRRETGPSAGCALFFFFFFFFLCSSTEEDSLSSLELESLLGRGEIDIGWKGIV